MRKYVIIDSIKVILFDAAISHSDICPNSNITSAGFFEPEIGCYGFSDSLNIGSKESDTRLVRKFVLKAAGLQKENKIAL